MFNLFAAMTYKQTSGYLYALAIWNFFRIWVKSLKFTTLFLWKIVHQEIWYWRFEYYMQVSASYSFFDNKIYKGESRFNRTMEQVSIAACQSFKPHRTKPFVRF